MKYLLLFCIIFSEPSHALRSDKADLRIGETVFFQSEVLKFKQLLKEVECIFGNTLQSKMMKTSKSFPEEGVIFRLKLKKYIKEIKYDVDDLKLQELLGIRPSECGVTVSSCIKPGSRRDLILSELYVQEYLLAAKNESEERIFFNRLRKLLGKRYDHFVYGK